MSNVHEKAVETLMRVRKELIEGIAQAGEAGGGGMSMRMAPQLVSVQQAIDYLEAFSNEDEKVSVAERMAAMRAKRNTNK